MFATNMKKLLANAGGSGGPVTVVGEISDNNTTTLDLSTITGIQDDDVVIVLFGNDTDLPDMSSSGWTELVRETNNPGSFEVNYGAWVQAYSAAVATVTLDATANVLIAIAFRDANVVDVSYEGVSYDAGSNTITPPAATVAVDDSVVLLYSFIDDVASTVINTPSGYTLQLTESLNSSGSGAIFTKASVAAGTETPGSITWDDFDSLAGLTFVIGY